MLTVTAAPALAGPKRTFESGKKLRVFAVLAEDDGGADGTCVAGPYIEIGTTPSKDPLVIPENVTWFVQPLDRSLPRRALRGLLAEMLAKGVPGVSFRERSAFRDADLREVVALKHLEYLDIAFTSVSPVGTPAMAGHPRLAHLDLDGLLLGEIGFAARLKALESIDCSSMMLTGGELAPLAKLPRLARVRATGGQAIDPGMFRVLRSTRSLRYLDGSLNPTLDDAALVGLSDFGALEHVVLQGTAVTDVGFAHLADIPRLATLDLTDCRRITGRGASVLKGAKTLKRLILRRTAVDDSGLAGLASARSIESLVLDDTAVTDAGLEHLTGLKKLRTLGLTDCSGVTDAALAGLAKMTELRELDLSGTSVTSSGVRALEKKLPRCYVTR